MNAPFVPTNTDHLPLDPTMTAFDRDTIFAMAEKAADRVAPLWPLKTFVAVNPFVGLADHEFAAACDLMGRRAGARTTMPRSFYAKALADGRFSTADIADVLAEGSFGELTLQAIITSLNDADQAAPTPLPLPSTIHARTSGTDWPVVIADHLSRLAAARYDEGQASWQMPFRNLGLWQAFKAREALDRSFDIAGLTGFRTHAAALPDDWKSALAEAVAELKVPEAALEGLFHRALMSLPGWSGFFRQKVWTARLAGGDDTVLLEWLTIILTVEASLLKLAQGWRQLTKTWSQEAADYLAAPASGPQSLSRQTDFVLQAAYERAWQRDLAARLSARKAKGTRSVAGRPAAQAVFCIDVRSEVYRRSLEVVAPDVATLGFAGFFGFALGYIPMGATKPAAMCPVLLQPKMIICEDVTDGAPDTRKQALAKQDRLGRIKEGWSSFKQAAVSCFGFVESAGAGAFGKLLTESMPSGRAASAPAFDGKGPVLDRIDGDWLDSGLSPEDRLAMAEGVLKAMSLTRDFARLVLLVGHGSSTVNNPHASGLDCGACGGHAGDINARVACLVMNDPAVRTGLKAKGMALPDDTVFVPALHDTTRDEVHILDAHLCPESHSAELAALVIKFKEAGHLARAERAGNLHLAGKSGVDEQVLARSVDWSQVRPEWGLAGCAAFIAAPRARTEGVDLGGRSFLHSYEWQADEGFSILELIMTAPMVVASWINLQYYGSAVDNKVFGSGNKVLHNVAGLIGVFEGHGGDLRPGLAHQSVHDGEKLVHEPMRLNVVIEAPIEAINGVIAKHPGVARLLDNGWLHLFAMNEKGQLAQRYTGNLSWAAFAGEIDERLAA